MTEQQHPMVPSNILLNIWESDWFNERQNVDVLLIEAYQAGADAELEACCEWASQFNYDDYRYQDELHALRRPKLSSLKEQSIALIDKIQGNKEMWDIKDLDVIRRALESLPD